MPPFDLSVAPHWKGRPIVDTADADDLDMRSAVLEHIHRLPRHEADEKAHSDYRHDKLVEAGAHHLSGMKASNAAGNMEAAQKHGVMYGLALKALGHDDLMDPPDEVVTASKNTPSESIARFKSHRGDAFSMPAPAEKDRQPKTLETQVKTTK